jgi:hypothetical protein
MKIINKFIFAAAAFPVLSAPLCGGVIMNMENVSRYNEENTKSSFVHYIGPESSRVEMSVNYQHPEKKGRSTQKSVIISRLDKKVLWMLMPASNGYCEFTFDELRKSVKSGSSLVPDSVSPSGFKYKKTSKSKKIAGFNSDEYVLSGKDLKGKAWVSEDKKLKPAAEFNRKQAAAMGVAVKGAVPGVLMGYDAASAKSSHNMTVKSVKFGDISADKFEIPKGYSRMESSAWKGYQATFDSKMIMEQMKKQVKEAAKEKAAETGKDALKKGVKGMLGF